MDAARPAPQGLTTMRTLFTCSLSREYLKGSKGLVVLRVKPTPTRFPINSFYTPMGNVPSHSLSIVCHPWGNSWCSSSSLSLSVGFSIQDEAMDVARGRYLLASLNGIKGWSKGLVVLRVRPTPTRFPTNSPYTPIDPYILRVCRPLLLSGRSPASSGRIRP